MKYFIIILLAFSTALFAGGKKIELYKTSSLYTSKKKASRTQWRRLPCKHCHGKGHVVMVIHKGNTSIRLLKQCPWCDGTGTRGLSKK